MIDALITFSLGAGLMFAAILQFFSWLADRPVLKATGQMPVGGSGTRLHQAAIGVAAVVALFSLLLDRYLIAMLAAPGFMLIAHVAYSRYLRKLGDPTPTEGAETKSADGESKTAKAGRSDTTPPKDEPVTPHLDEEDLIDLDEVNLRPDPPKVVKVTGDGDLEGVKVGGPDSPDSEEERTPLTVVPGDGDGEEQDPDAEYEAARARVNS